MPNTKPRKKSIALDIRVLRDVGVHRVSIFSPRRREDGFQFYLQLLPAINRLNRAAMRISRPE